VSFKGGGIIMSNAAVNATEKTASVAQPNYEAEYYRQEKLIKELLNENRELRETLINMCKWLFFKQSL
jgi:hypothetical protein